MTGGDPGSQTIAYDSPHASECSLAAAPDAARAAREFTRSTLHRWERDNLIDDASLVVSELVTNAVLHGAPEAFGDDDAGAGGRPILLQLVNQTTSVMCVVHDASSAPPRVKSGDLLAETYRGLRIVAELSAAWGWTPSERRGKAVWAKLDAQPQPADAIVLDDDATALSDAPV